MGGELFDFVNDFQTFHANGERSWRRTNTTEMLTVTEEHVAKMIRQILLAVDYMHSMDVVHRDLKLENVMLTEPFAADKEPEVKVVDLGFSRQVFGTTPPVSPVSHARLVLACTAASSCGSTVTEQRVDGGGGDGGCTQADCARASGTNEMFTACGSTLYIAPEVLSAKTTGKGYGRECDLWAVGVMSYILLCCRPPFSGDSSYSVGQAIQKGAFSYPDYALVSEEAKELIAGLLHVDPARRLTAKQALQMPWIAAMAPLPEQQPTAAAKVVTTRTASLSAWVRSCVSALAAAGTAVTNSGVPEGAGLPGVALPV